MHSPSVLHNNNILVLHNNNKHNKAGRRFLQHQFFESSLPSDAPEQRAARVVDNEHKRDYLVLLAELHDANDPSKLFALHSFPAGSSRRATQEFRAREAVKSPPVNTVPGDTMRAIAESSLLRGLMQVWLRARRPMNSRWRHTPCPVRRPRHGPHPSKYSRCPGAAATSHHPTGGVPDRNTHPTHLAPQSVGKERSDV